MLGVEVARKSTDTNSAGFVKIVETRVARFQGGFQHHLLEGVEGMTTDMDRTAGPVVGADAVSPRRSPACESTAGTRPRSRTARRARPRHQAGPGAARRGTTAVRLRSRMVARIRARATSGSRPRLVSTKTRLPGCR